jgi:hypothetical protein
MKLTFAILCLLALPAYARAVDARLLDAICTVESMGGKELRGDAGRARGHYHMHQGAWADVSAARRRHGLTTWDYSHADSPVIGRAYARDYLTLLTGQFQRATGRAPTAAESYALYNCGYAGFREAGFQLRRLNPKTRAAAQRVANLSAQ